jgi:hypothetical protein
MKHVFFFGLLDLYLLAGMSFCCLSPMTTLLIVALSLPRQAAITLDLTVSSFQARSCAFLAIYTCLKCIAGLLGPIS